jgi:uncharacterized protein YdeI (YjbR/CyaY-like superfamily)
VLPEPVDDMSTPDYPTLTFDDRAAWLAWLDENHAAERGVWLRLAKKGAPFHTVTYAEALDVALCHGWIDGQARGVDEHSYVQKFTPRGKRSLWSKRNREHVARLVESGEMRPAGLAAVEAAKADGRWDRAYDAPSSAEVPADLAAALAASPAAGARFGTLKSRNRFAILHRVQTAVKPETRARRIANFVEMLERGETPYPE